MRMHWAAILLISAVAGRGFAAAPAEPGAAGGAAPVPLGAALEIKLKDIDERAGKIQDLTARFEQKKFTALLKKPLVSRGWVRMKGSVVRWDTEVPEPAVLHSDGNRIRMFYPRQRVVEVYPIDRRITDLAASPLPRLAALREHFRIEPADLREIAESDADAEASKDRRVALRLVPTDAFLKEHVDQVLVLLDVARAYVARVQVDDADGDKTVIAFGDVKLDDGLKDADVALAVPPGTRVSRPLEGVQGGGGGAASNGGGVSKAGGTSRSGTK